MQALKYKSEKLKSVGYGLASCGELAQGYINNQPFLVNLPIDYSTAIIIDASMSSKNFSSNGLAISKIRKFEKLLAERILPRDLAKSFHTSINIINPIPRGKGMASSTAEMVAFYHAFINFCERQFNLSRSELKLEPDELSELIVMVEPTDGLYFPGISLINHLTGICSKSYVNLPKLSVLIIDEGGEIDTVGNSRSKAKIVADQNQNEMKEILKLIEDGFKNKNPKKLCKAATISSIVQQNVRKNIYFDSLKELIGDEILGVNCAHSGVILGVLFEPHHLKKVLKKVSEVIPQKLILGSFDIKCGGMF